VLTIGERILVHLAQFRKQGDDFVCPPEMSQAGIATALDITRAHAAIELRRAIDAGRVTVRVAHVTGMPTRRKVYTLTLRGSVLAEQVWGRAARTTPELVFPDGRSERLAGRQALEALRRFGVPEGRAFLLLLTRSRIDLRATERPIAVRSAATPEANAAAVFHRAFVAPVAWQFEVVLGPPNAPPVKAAA
jgi:hypothetical protein